MKNFRQIITITLLFVLILFAGYLPGYRYFYGVWDPSILPDRIECYGRRYYISNNSPGLLSESYSIKSLNILTGKRLYTSHPKEEFVPTVIFLDIGNGMYQAYSLSGGP